MSLTIIVAFSVLPCVAKEYKGEIVKMDKSRLELSVKGEGNLSFQVTNLTRVFRDGEIAEVHRLLPHSRVRVVEKNGKVELVIVEEAPK